MFPIQSGMKHKNTMSALLFNFTLECAIMNVKKWK